MQINLEEEHLLNLVVVRLGMHQFLETDFFMLYILFVIHFIQQIQV